MRLGWSEQLPEFVCRHTDNGQDVPQGSLGHIAARVDRDHHAPTIDMAHHMVTSADPHDREASPFQRLDYLRPRISPGSNRASGDVETQRQLVRRTDHSEQ